MNKCTYTNYISNGWIETEASLDPKNYLDCKDEEELKDWVVEDLEESLDYGNVIVYDSEYEYDIPEDFIKEWRKLKNNK